MKDQERGIMRRIVLEMLGKRHVNYTHLEKKMTATCYPIATTSTFKSQLHYLLNNGYITQVARSIYQIILRGENYLALLVS